MGSHPVESVAMLAKIAAATEAYRTSMSPGHFDQAKVQEGIIEAEELIAASVETTIRRMIPATVIVPTHSGRTARSIARFRLPVWISALSSEHKTCQDLLFSYGVFTCHEPDHPDDWQSWARRWLAGLGLKGRFVVLTEGPSRKHPERNHRMEIIDLKQ